jgi:hypothetical protein
MGAWNSARNEVGRLPAASSSAASPCHPEPTALQKAQSRSEEFMREAKDLKESRPDVI